MKNIILQGLPGVGKTTLIKKIKEKLSERKVQITGFYTEELRDDTRSRVGFDIITFDNKKAILARKSANENPAGTNKFKVGNYSVHLEEFEALVLPIFNMPTSVLVVDEIGKMELFSEKFENAIRKAMADRTIQVIATMPLKSHLKFIKEDSNNKIFLIDKRNRDFVLDEIMSYVKNQ